MVNVYYETIDTGESREFFGHTAKHLIMRERRVAEAGACGFTHQIEKDGWYIPPGKPVAGKSSYWLAASHFGALSLNGVICHDTVVTHGVASLPGFPVFEADGEVTREVLELSNNPLDKSLFEVPNGFKKVDALPGEPWFPGPTVCEWNGKNWSGLSNLDSINFESIAWFGSYSAVKV